MINLDNIIFIYSLRKITKFYFIFFSCDLVKLAFSLLFHNKKA